MNDLISRQAAQDKLKSLINEMETIFSDIREKLVDDSVCGLCEYDCDHGIDGCAYECPGFDRDDCFKLKEKYRDEWMDLSGIPSVTPKEPEPCEDAISRQAALDVFGLSEKTRKYGGDYSGYDTMMLYEIQDELEDLPSVTPKQRWIPLAEREPEKEGEYLVTFDDGFVATVTYSETDTNGGMDWELWADSGEPIAWMLLPTPYKAESEGEG